METIDTSDRAAGTCGVAVIEACRRPRRKSEVSVRTEPEEDGTRVLYQSEREAVYMINNGGMAVLELCDGTRTVGEIIEEVRRRYVIPEGVDVDREIQTFLLVLSRAAILGLD